MGVPGRVAPRHNNGPGDQFYVGGYEKGMRDFEDQTTKNISVPPPRQIALRREIQSSFKENA